jgi:hypothetical protein
MEGKRIIEGEPGIRKRVLRATIGGQKDSAELAIELLITRG